MRYISGIGHQMSRFRAGLAERGFLGSFAVRGWLSLKIAPVAVGAGPNFGRFAVGAALGAAGHGAGGGEAEVCLADAQGARRVAAALVEGGEPLVGVNADEALGDALLVEVLGALWVAVLLRALGRLVALHRRLEIFERVPVRPDPLPLLGVEAVERPCRLCRLCRLCRAGLAAEDAP